MVRIKINDNISICRLLQMLSRALSINYHDYVTNLWRSANAVKVNLYLTGRIIHGSANFYYCAKLMNKGRAICVRDMTEL